MLKENETIKLTGEEAVNIIKEVNYLLISLGNIAHYYYSEPVISDDKRLEYESETTKFIDKNKVTHRLAEIRRILSSKFDNSLGDDDMDDIERATEDTLIGRSRGLASKKIRHYRNSVVPPAKQTNLEFN